MHRGDDGCNRPAQAIMTRADDVKFGSDGRPIGARLGQSAAASLHANRIGALTVSSKFHRARGICCAAGHCPSCLLNVDGRPNSGAARSMSSGGWRCGPGSCDVRSGRVWRASA